MTDEKAIDEPAEDFKQNSISKEFVITVNELVKTGNHSYTSIANELKWNKSAMSAVINGKRDVPVEIWEEFTRVYKSVNQTENPAKEYKNGDTAKDRHIRLRLSLKNGKKLIPETNYRGAAGNIVVINDNPELILEWIDYPYLKDVQGTIEVYGKSMEPKYPSGTRVAVKLLEHKKVIQPGEDYFIIDVNYQGYIKRLYPVRDNPDIVELRSYNEDKVQYPDYTMPWEEILYVFKVRAGIQLA